MAEKPQFKTGAKVANRSYLPTRLHRFPKSDDGVTIGFWITVLGLPLAIISVIISILSVYNMMPFQGAGSGTNSSPTKTDQESPNGSKSEGNSRTAATNTGNDTRTVQQGQPVIPVPDANEAHLKAFHDAATAWRNRKRYETPDVAKVLSDLTNEDRQRIEEEGYASDLQVLQGAAELLQWIQRGFTKNTPVHFYTDRPETNDDLVVKQLQSAFECSAHLVDEDHAALLFEVSKTNIYGQTEQYATEKPVGYASFFIQARWLNGSPFWKRTVRHTSTDNSGSGNMLSNRDSAQLNATNDAISDAANLICRLQAK